MERIRSFEAPHKALRNVLSKFSLCLGHTDIAEPAQLKHLKELGNEMFTLLNDHVHTENEHTLRHLEERAKGASRHDREDHERLESIQNSLEQHLKALTGRESPGEMHTFYLNFSMFHSEYLKHIYEEETVTELLLQKYFTDEELMQHRIAVMQRIEFPVLLLWLKYVVPAQPEDASVGMLSGFKANAPKEVFDKVLEVIKGELDAGRFKRLLERLQ